MAVGDVVATRCDELYESISEKTCQYCGGDLVIGGFKGDRAVICDECDTPAARTLASKD